MIDWRRIYELERAIYGQTFYHADAPPPSRFEALVTPHGLWQNMPFVFSPLTYSPRKLSQQEHLAAALRYIAARYGTSRP